MTFSAQEERRIRAASEAAGWMQHLEAGDLSAAERAEFVDWLRESPVHVSEMLRARQLTDELAEFAGWKDVAESVAVHERGDSVVRLHPHHGEDLRRTRSPAAGRRSRRAPWVAAASVLLAVLVGFILAPSLRSTLVSTQNGERREITLEDGSEITLAANTTLRYRLAATLRSIALERGEAQFHVAKDAKRPFVVTAAQTSIRAVGTVFNVINNGEAVVVSVTEGRVAVEPIVDAAKGPAQVSSSSIALAANQQVAVSSNGLATPVHAYTGPTDRASFGEQLSFDAETVARIVQRFNAVNDIKIRITDEALAQRRVTGIFSAKDPESFVAFLEAAAGAVPVEHSPGEIDVGIPDRHGSSAVPH